MTVKISELPAVTAVADADEFEVNQSLASKKQTLGQVRHGLLTLGANTTLFAGAVSGDSVEATGGNLTAWQQSYGLSGSLLPDLAGGVAPTKLADGWVSFHAVGSPASYQVAYIPVASAPSRLLMVLALDLDADADGTTTAGLAFAGVLDYAGGWGCELARTQIRVMTGPSASVTASIALVAGLQIVAVYIDFVGNSWRIKARRGDTFYAANGTFSSAPTNPGGQTTLNAFVGSFSADASTHGRNNCGGFRYQSVPSGLSVARLDSLMLGELGKVAADAYAITRQLPEPATAAIWQRVANGTNTETIDDSDHQKLIELTHTSGTITVTFAATTAVDKEGGITKATGQTVDLMFGAGATWQSPDGSMAGTNFTLLDTITWKVLRNTLGNSAVYLIKGGTNRPVDLGGTIIRAYRESKSNNVTGNQNLGSSTYAAGQYIAHNGGAAQYTLPSRVTAIDAAVTIVVMNRNTSGNITWAATGGVVMVPASPADLAPGQMATITWEHDGTTERAWVRIG